VFPKNVGMNIVHPVDVLTYVALQHSGWPRERILGSGTVLDSARFRYLISRTLGVGVHNVHAYILGEHGDSEFPAWSLTNIGGVPVDYYSQTNYEGDDWHKRREEIVEQVRNSAYHIIGYKGSTNFAVGLALTRIVGSVLRNQASVLTVSTRLEGEYGYEGLCISVPCLVDDKGVDKILLAELTPQEQESMAHSVKVLKQSIADLEKKG